MTRNKDLEEKNVHMYIIKSSFLLYVLTVIMLINGDELFSLYFSTISNPVHNPGRIMTGRQ